MEPINQHNYEAYFLDYFEGSLPAEEVAELMLFLEKHPSLKEEFESFENISLLPETDAVVFAGKEKMKMPEITLENYEVYFLDESEGALNQKEQQTLKYFLSQHPELEPQLTACREIKLIPNQSVVFENKKKLYRTPADFEKAQNTIQGGRVISLPRTALIAVAAAATVVLLVGMWLFFQPQDNGQSWGGTAFHVQISPAPQHTIMVASNIPQAKTLHPSSVKEHKGAKQTMLVLTSWPSNQTQLDQAPEDQQMPDLQMMAVQSQMEVRAPVQVEKKKEFMNLKEYASSKFLGGMLGTAAPSSARKHPGWEMIKLASRGFNRISDRKIIIHEDYDHNGELVSYAVNAGTLSYSKAVKEKE